MRLHPSGRRLRTGEPVHSEAAMNQAEEAPESGSGFQLEDVFEILERRVWWIVGGALGGLLLGVALYFVLPAQYSARTTILVEPQGIPSEYIKSTITLDVEQRLATLRERVTSYANLNELIDRVGPERLDPSGKLTREKLMAKVTSNLEVSAGRAFSSKAANIFEVAFWGDDPQVVADTTREIANLFITENLKDRAQQASATAEFLDQELERLRSQVNDQEEKIRRFKEQRMGTLPTQLDANLRSLDRLNVELASNLEAQESISQRISLLQRQLDGIGSPGSSAGPAPGSIASALMEARRRLLEAERIYTDEHPNVQRLRGDVERLEQEAATQASESPATRARSFDPTTLGIRRELDQAALESSTRRREEGRLRQEIAELQKRVEETPRMEQDLLTLTRDYDNMVTTYQTLLAKRFEAALAKNLESSQRGERFKVLRPASVPPGPAWPDLMMLLPGGLAAGLGIAALLILLQEFRNPAFRSVSRLTRTTGLPVVASIPRIDNDQIFETPPTGEVDARLVVFTAPESAPAEQYRSFVPLFLEDEERRVVLVTSAARGDGKSLSTMNLALTVACDLDRRVLLIDGDLRRPTAHRLLKLRARRGLGDVLRGEATLDECSLPTRVRNLTLLPAGAPQRNPLALLTGRRFLELIETARKRYDAVFIDSPPLLPVVDTRFLRKMADLVIFVVRADATPRDAVVRSLRDLRGAAGLVFNQVSPGSFRRYYYYDAYSRYAYGDPSDTSENEDGRGRG